MPQKNVVMLAGLALVFAAAGYLLFANVTAPRVLTEEDAAPQAITLTGIYECLPRLNASDPQTEEECAFGIRADDGTYYAVNFGQSAYRMEQFQMGARITAEGFLVIKEALSTDYWQKFNMRGVFTITRMIDPVPNGMPDQPQAKIDINAVCEGALAYMTFPDGASSAAFVAECKEGKHPEVIEQYRAQMGLGDGAAI